MEMHLPNRYTTLVDEDVWLRKCLFLLPWYAARQTGGRIYVIAKVRDPLTGKQGTLRLHREVMNAPDGMDVDHRDGPSLDNRRQNLCVSTNARNQQNTGSWGGTSRFKGVSWGESKRRWRVAFNLLGRTHFVGTFTDEVEAVMAYNKAAARTCEGFARLNRLPYNTTGGTGSTDKVVIGTERHKKTYANSRTRRIQRKCRQDKNLKA